MHRISAAAALVLALLLLPPAAARAGSYHVYTCVAAGKVWPNNAWSAAPASGVSIDSTCAGNSIRLLVGAPVTMADNTSAALVFTSPPGTTIGGFALTRQLDYVDTPAANTHAYYAFYALGSTVFAGAGDYADATRNALNKQNQWYGYPAGAAHVGRSTVTAASFPALAGYAGTANQLSIRVGCFNRGTACTTTAGSGISHVLHGADVTVNDAAPAAVTVEASGLLAGGARNGSDPVAPSATDGAGIRRVDLIDATDPAAPAVVGSEDYAVARSDAGGLCDYSRPAPCPQLTHEVVRPTALAAGDRQLVVRVTDTAGNVSDRGPYAVSAITPSDRGPLNGTNGTDGARFQLAFTHTKAPRKTVAFGTHVKVHGRLLNASGQPIGGARVALLTRDLRRGARSVPRQTLTTAADGTFTAKVAATASRLLQFAWLEHINDARFTANGFLALRARAAASLRVSTLRPAVGRRMTLRGRIHGVGRGGVTVILQGRPRGARHYTAFAAAVAGGHGLFKAHYTFRSGASRGRSFQFRARIRPGVGFPYEPGYSSTATVRVR